MRESARCVCKMRMPVLMRRHNGDVTKVKRVVTFRTAQGTLVDIPVLSDKQLDKYEIGQEYILPKQQTTNAGA